MNETEVVVIRRDLKPTVFIKGTKPNPIEYTLVDTPELVAFMIDNVTEWPSDGIALFIDLGGKSLGANNYAVRLMSAYHKYLQHTCLVAVSELGTAAYNTTGSKNTSMKNILESRYIIKGFWDTQNDAAGLYRKFGIEIAGVEDVQLVVC